MEDTCSLEKLSKFLCFFLSFIISGKLKFMLDLLIHQKLGIVLETLNENCVVMFFVLKGFLFELETIYFNTLIRLRKNIIMTFRTLQKMIDKKKNSWPLNCLGPCSPGLMSKEICCLIIWKEMFYLVSVDFVQFVPIHTSHKVAY